MKLFALYLDSFSVLKELWNFEIERKIDPTIDVCNILNLRTNILCDISWNLFEIFWGSYFAQMVLFHNLYNIFQMVKIKRGLQIDLFTMEEKIYDKTT